MKIFLLLIVGLLFAGCASYSDTTNSVQLGENLHRVSMKGNAFNEQADAQDFALLKAAEVTIDSGKRYFTIQNATDTTRVSTYVSPGSSSTFTTGSATANTSGSVYGNQVQANTSVFGTSSSSTTYNPAQTYNFVKPGVDVLIRTHNDKPQVGYFDAQEIVKFIGPRLNPKRWGEKNS